MYLVHLLIYGNKVVVSKDFVSNTSNEIEASNAYNPERSIAIFFGK